MPAIWEDANHTVMTWADTAADYASNIAKVTSSAATQLLRMATSLKGIDDKSNILDIGTGLGAVVDAIINTIPAADVLATDTSQVMLSVVEHRMSTKQLAQVKTEVIDANILTEQLKGRTFSHVFGTFVLQFMKDCASTIGQIHEAIKPGGVAAVGIWGIHCAQPQIWTKACQSIDPSYELPQPCEDPNAPWTISGVASLLESAGFLDVEAVSRRVPFQLNTEAYCRYWFDSQSPASVAYTRTWYGDMDAVREKVEHIVRYDYNDGQAMVMQIILAVARKER